MTKTALLKQILEQGIVPKCGEAAWSAGQETQCVNVYTSRESVREALSPKGDYMVTHPGVNPKDLCVLNLLMEDDLHRFISTNFPQACELRRVVKPHEFVVLDTNLRPISSMELAELTAE